MAKIAPFLAGCVAALALNLANAGPAPEDLTGSYTQNAPCKSDGTDPADILVRISPEGIPLQLTNKGGHLDAYLRVQLSTVQVQNLNRITNVLLKR
jgi:hypothetical protein